MHGHDFRVTVTLAGATLDSDGLLCDFHDVEARLGEIVRPFRNADLNATPPFDAINPSAEQIARHIGDALASSLGHQIPARVESVAVTEATGCRAIYAPSTNTNT